MTNPSVLLMDEPTEGLAPVIVELLTAALQRLRTESGLTMILVEQNSRVALDFCERTIVMDKGRIVYDGASATLRADPERLAGLIGDADEHRRQRRHVLEVRCGLHHDQAVIAWFQPDVAIGRRMDRRRAGELGHQQRRRPDLERDAYGPCRSALGQVVGVDDAVADGRARRR